MESQLPKRIFSSRRGRKKFLRRCKLLKIALKNEVNLRRKIMLLGKFKRKDEMRSSNGNRTENNLRVYEIILENKSQQQMKW